MEAQLPESSLFPPSAKLTGPTAVGGVVRLKHGSQLAIFRWRAGLEPAEFVQQLRAAIRHITGLDSLAGVELRFGEQEPRSLLPRDFFEGRIECSETLDDPPCIDVIAARAVPSDDVARVLTSVDTADASTLQRPQQRLQQQPQQQQQLPRQPQEQHHGLQPPQRQPQRQNGGTARFQKSGGSQLQFMQMMAANKNPVPALAPGLELTVAEVARHRTASDCWTIFQGKVYDLTSYVAFHPGGKRQLMRGAGVDSTSLFNEVHPWVSFDGLLARLCLGLLVCNTELPACLEEQHQGEVPNASSVPRAIVPAPRRPRTVVVVPGDRKSVV